MTVIPRITAVARKKREGREECDPEDYRGHDRIRLIDVNLIGAFIDLTSTTSRPPELNASNSTNETRYIRYAMTVRWSSFLFSLLLESFVDS